MGEVTTIPSKAVRRQAEKPTSPEDGLLWYDTSAQVLKQFKNGSFQNVGTSPDGSSIIKNENGKLAVNQPSEKVIGNFENGKDDFTFQNDVKRTNSSTVFGTRGFNGDFMLELASNGDNTSITSTATLTNVDLTGIDKLKFYYRWERNDSSNINNSFQDLSVDINGFEQFGTENSGISKNNWAEIEIDVSSFSGTNNLTFRTKDNFARIYHLVDFIRLEKPKPTRTASNVT